MKGPAGTGGQFLVSELDDFLQGLEVLLREAHLALVELGKLGYGFFLGFGTGFGTGVGGLAGVIFAVDFVVHDASHFAAQIARG